MAGLVSTLLIIDDHPVVREGLKAFLNLQSDLEVIGEAGELQEGLERVISLQPDLVLLDLEFANGNGLSLLPKLRALEPPPRVLVLTSFLDEDYVRRVIQGGAAGFLVKHAGPEKLLDGVRAVIRGEMTLDPGAVTLLAQPFDDPLRDLTAREREVLALVSEGLSNKQIAQRLEVAEKTVKTHVSSVLAKLRVKGRTQAALYAKERGW